MGILELMKERRIYFDGGMGSLLQARGLKPGELPETWNLSRPEIITEIHREYLDAGSDVVTTNTFGANHFKFKAEDGYSVKEIVTAAVRNAKNAIAAAGHGYAALDMGPTGKLLKPYGDLEFEDAYEAYKEVVLIGKAAGADLVIIETMGDGYELKAAVLAAKENSDLPVFATVTLDEKGKMLTGQRGVCDGTLRGTGSRCDRFKLWSRADPAAAVYERYGEGVLHPDPRQPKCGTAEKRGWKDRLRYRCR